MTGRSGIARIRFLVLFGLVLALMFNFSALPVNCEESEEGVEDELEDGESEEEFEDGDDDEGPDIESMAIDGQTIHFGIPDDNDEFHSTHMPDEHRCDACYILMRQFRKAFDEMNNKRPSLKKKLPESEIIDILETSCNDEFLNVGIKEYNGKKKLSGPGSMMENVPGIMQGGGKWPYRMHAMCLDIVGEVGEQEIYEHYLGGDMDTTVCMKDYNVCIKMLKRPKKAKKEEL